MKLYGKCIFMILCFSSSCQTLSKALLMSLRIVCLFFVGEVEGYSLLSEGEFALSTSVCSEPVLMGIVDVCFKVGVYRGNYRKMVTSNYFSL